MFNVRESTCTHENHIIIQEFLCFFSPSFASSIRLRLSFGVIAVLLHAILSIFMFVNSKPSVEIEARARDRSRQSACSE